MQVKVFKAFEHNTVLVFTMVPVGERLYFVEQCMAHLMDDDPS
jgi:hypothetical protein